AHLHAERQGEISKFLVAAHLVGAGGGDVQDLAAQRQNGLRFAIARLFGGAAGAVAFDQEDFGVFLAGAGAVGELARQTKFARRGLARDFFFLAPTHAVFGLLDRPFEQAVGFVGV